MTPHVSRVVSLAALFAAVAVVGGRLEMAVLAAPFVARLAFGVLRRPGRVDVDLTTSYDRCLEGEQVDVRVSIVATGAVDSADVVVRLGEGLRIVSGEPRVTLSLAAGETRDVTLRVRPRRWGLHAVGPVSVTWYTRGRFSSGVSTAGALPLRVLPVPESFGATGPQPYMRALTGAHVSRAAGEGIELAGIRPYLSGDQLRRVNWRVTARTGELHVTQHRPERNADVVLFLDTFLDPGPPGQTSLDIAVRASAAVAEHYLAQQDRVGVVGFGGVMRWLTSATGSVQRYRIVEHLLGTEVVLSYAWKDLDVLPPGSLPPRALVLAFSPLLDERAIGAVVELSRRGFGVVIVDTSPTPVLPPPTSRVSEVAQRIWYLERDTLLRRIGEVGVPVVRWSGPGSLDTVLHEVSRLHSRPRAAIR